MAGECSLCIRWTRMDLVLWRRGEQQLHKSPHALSRCGSLSLENMWEAEAAYLFLGAGEHLLPCLNLSRVTLIGEHMGNREEGAAAGWNACILTLARTFPEICSARHECLPIACFHWRALTKMNLPIQSE